MQRHCLLLISSAIAATSALASACTGNGLFGNSDATDSSDVKIVAGRAVPAGKFDPVFIWTDEGSSLTRSYCTGTKVAPNLVLTAAHCVLVQSPLPGRRYIGPWRRVPALGANHHLRYSFSRKILPHTSSSRLRITAVHLHPNVERCLATEPADDASCTWRTPVPDVALIEVAPSGTEPFATAPSATVSFNVVSPGLSIFIMGYGAQADQSIRPPTLKYGTVTVATSQELNDALAGTDAETDGLPDLANSFGALGNLVDHRFANLGSGDSGGPVMLDDGNTIVGVNSDGYCQLTKPDCQRSTNSIFARLDTESSYKVGQWLAPLLGATP